MAEIQPLRALRYDLAVTGGLQPVLAPPYDVVDEEQRAELAARSPYNVVGIDLPRDPSGGDPYGFAATLMSDWIADGALVADDEPALFALTQDAVAPDGTTSRRHGLLAAVRIEPYGAGRIRPHERTHPGPKEDRLRLTRATKANLSPIFALYSDPGQVAWEAVAEHVGREPWGSATDDEGTVQRLWRVTDAAAIADVQGVLGDAELLIADGHHRYETARVYAEEVGGEGPHRYVLSCLVALEDPGLRVFPTHRLITGLADDRARQVALRDTLMADFEVTPIEHGALVPAPSEDRRLAFGYIDAFHRQAYRCVLRDQGVADAALPGAPGSLRHLDTAVLEALVLKGPLALSDEDIGAKRGLDYARSDDEALEAVLSGAADAAFFLRASPVSEIAAVAADGADMPPKSTFFHPKVPTGLAFHLLA